MKYWMITCERGHCGIKHSSEIKFAIIAETLLHACNIARKMPSVKHAKPILFGKEITKTEYLEYKQLSAYERYNQHKSSHYKNKRHR